MSHTGAVYICVSPESLPMCLVLCMCAYVYYTRVCVCTYREHTFSVSPGCSWEQGALTASLGSHISQLLIERV